MALEIGIGSKSNHGTVETKRLGVVNSAHTLGIKRVAVSDCLVRSIPTPPWSSFSHEHPHKKARIERLHLECLPQDILVQILCFVGHEDLKRLFLVSRRVREAALIAEKLHFSYTTPPSKTALPPSLFGDLEEEHEGAPNAPRRQRVRTPRDRSKLEEISLTLFPLMLEC